MTAQINTAEVSDGLGIVTALVSAFHVVDSYGDVMMPGAFQKTLAAWAASGDQIPFLWNHDTSDPFNFIGDITKAEETAAGLLVEVQFDLENKKAHQVYRNLQSRRIKQFSIGYYLKASATSVRDGLAVLELYEIDLLEASVTAYGANPETELLDVKALAADLVEAKAGRTHSAATIERMRAAYELLGELLQPAAAPEAGTDTDAKAAPGQAATAQEPPTATAQELPAKDAANEAVKALQTQLRLTVLKGLINV
ncbi:HK97 family phage prohead protease [Cryobacterium sp. SO1]|uniref:HK97 family phage prohead protease n=1 Tax=Cryobacterium sp. SO1 TaxID=1897061 RepID=UPI0013EEC744|nr:HK97 family phage prohead protease [Cryobacterium sp. SO1]